MTIENFKLHRRARMALLQLDPDDQARMRERLAMLADIPRSEWPAELVSRLLADPSLYLVRVDASWRLIIGDDDGRPEVQAIMRQETMNALAQAAGKNGH
jgi:hypothetical protein